MSFLSGNATGAGEGNEPFQTVGPDAKTRDISDSPKVLSVIQKTVYRSMF